jgi:diguanylate cyclase (GGDEF)-like protein/excisionase family DNA binding protein
VVVADTVATFPLAGGARRLDADYCEQLGTLVLRLLSETVLHDHIDSRGNGVSELSALVTAREVTPEQLFSFVYIVLSTALDELSRDERVGAGSEPWPQAKQSVRRAAFDLLGAWTTRQLNMPLRASIEDPLTTLMTRPMLDAVMPKECCRAERFEHWMSMMLIDIDTLSDINASHGYGVGDRILERMGILMRTFFREHDWVGRYDEDTFAVLLPETNPEDARTLAERTRTTIEERLTFRDYRTEQRIIVTVSIAVASAKALEGDPIDRERFTAETERALARAKAAGGNRVEQIQIPPRLISIEEAAQLLGTNVQGIEQLVTSGSLDPVNAGRYVRLDRAAVETLANSTD